MTETRTEWQQFFDAHAPHYHKNKFTHNTKSEVDFLLSLFSLPAGARILDVGCGAGRHTVEFAVRGFEVTGLDISEGMLKEARKLSEERGVSPTYVHADATDFSFNQPFDFAICLCEGAFNLIGGAEDPIAHDMAILKNVAASLKPDAPFVLNALNGYSLIRQLKDETVEQRSFDPLTMITTYKDTWSLPEGPVEMQIRERLYIPPEVAAMLHTAGFKVHALYGGTAGEWDRRPLKLDEVEAMFVCRRR